MKEPEGLVDVAFEFRGYRLDPRQRRLTDPGGRRLKLSARVFDTLCVLVRRAGETVSKADLMEAVWPDAVVEENNLNQAISTLRRTLGDDRRNPAFIATITGRGYQFVADVVTVTERAPAFDTRGLPSGRRRAVRMGVALLGLALVGVVFYGIGDRAERSPAIGLDDAGLVTPFEGSHSSPTLSPDGTLMAFVSDRTGTPQIWVQGLPDGTPIQITDGDSPARSPSWSPVDDAILFERATADGIRAVWLVDALGTTQPRVVVRDARHPRFAPDGDSFVFSRGSKGIHIGTLDGREIRQLDSLPETPGFAEPMPVMNAAGDIAFVLADESPVGNLWFHRAADGTFHQLTRAEAGFPGVNARSPAWLPDGRSILYAAAPEDPTNFHLWLADAETGRTTRLSTGVGGYDEPAVSRDGTRLAYSHSRPLWRLVATNPGNGEKRVIYESRTPIVLPVVSPDGDSVVWFGENVYTVGIDGGEAVQRTFGAPGEATLPTWSRDDSVVYFYNERSLHRLDPETGLSEVVVEDFHWSSRNWLAVHGSKLAYQQRGLLPGSGRTVIRDLESGEQRELEDAVLPTDWSRDGRALLARRKSDSAIVICRAPRFRCVPLLEAGQPVRGAMPRWSADEQRVYFRDASRSSPGYAAIRSVSRDGGEVTTLAEVGPYERAGMYFGVTADDEIVWPEFDTRGISEIWTVDLEDAAAADRR
ncbi:MAG: winged helix-turn-helix domain-containing protein [Gammaproteobacteria bacterium]